MNIGEQAYRALARLARHDLRPNRRPAPFAEYLTRHFLASFLHRLTLSAHADAFVLKGGILLAVYGARRPTKDVDSQAIGATVTPAHLTQVTRDIASVDTDDGVEFDPDSIDIQQIRDDADYPHSGYASGPVATPPEAQWSGTSPPATRSCPPPSACECTAPLATTSTSSATPRDSHRRERRHPPRTRHRQHQMARLRRHRPTRAKPAPRPSPATCLRPSRRRPPRRHPRTRHTPPAGLRRRRPTEVGIAQRLIADGEPVVDVPAKLSARLRFYATGQGRKTDDTDAHSIALVGVRMSGLRPVVAHEQIEILRLLVDRRRRIGEDHTVKICQLHQLLLELIPGGAKKDLSAVQARRLLAEVQPSDLVSVTRKRVAMELVEDLERIYQRKKDANKELVALVKTTRTGLLDLHGIGPSGAARLLVEVGDITRFPTRAHFASWTGTAPIDASSGDHVRHRLSRGGNRQINRVLHLMAVVQLRNPTEGRAYFDRKKADGKTSMEAMRCLKRRLSDVVYKTMLTDYVTMQATGPGGHRGTTLTSSVAGSHPHTGSSDQSRPGPVTRKPKTPQPATA